MTKYKPDYNVLAATKYVVNGAKKDGPMDVEQIFGENTFGLEEMQLRLPKAVYKSLLATIELGTQVDPGIAESVALAMKEWAVERGATHFTHWFPAIDWLDS